MTRTPLKKAWEAERVTVAGNGDRPPMQKRLPVNLVTRHRTVSVRYVRDRKGSTGVGLKSWLRPPATFGLRSVGGGHRPLGGLVLADGLVVSAALTSFGCPQKMVRPPDKT